MRRDESSRREVMRGNWRGDEREWEWEWKVTGVGLKQEFYHLDISS